MTENSPISLSGVLKLLCNNFTIRDFFSLRSKNFVMVFDKVQFSNLINCSSRCSKSSLLKQ